EASECLSSAGETVPHRLRVADVGGDGPGRRAVASAFRDGRIEHIGAASGEHDGPAILKESEGRGLADSRPGAGHDRDFVGHAEGSQPSSRKLSWSSVVKVNSDEKLTLLSWCIVYSHSYWLFALVPSMGMMARYP